MKKYDPLIDIEMDVRADTAASLGRAGRRLLQSVQAVVASDQHGVGTGKQRKALLHAAADALWALVVQREMLGLTDHRELSPTFGVTAEMWALMGASRSEEPPAVTAPTRG